jgi:pimeloyl-ACP methyl ester carboxylesterase
VPTLPAPDGLQPAEDVAGEGPPVVLHHGFAADADANWVRPGIVDALVASGRTVVALDARGHGRSAQPHDLHAYVVTAEVVAFLEEVRASA